jgi:hypothetical protein
VTALHDLDTLRAFVVVFSARLFAYGFEQPGVCLKDDPVVAKHRVPCCCAAAILGGRPRVDDGIDTPLAQDNVKVRAKKAAVAMLSTACRLSIFTFRNRNKRLDGRAKPFRTSDGKAGIRQWRI